MQLLDTWRREIGLYYRADRDNFLD